MANDKRWKIAITNGGDYSAVTTYKPLTRVRHNKASWISTKETTGNEPVEGSEYWQLDAKDGNEVTVDKELSAISENPVENKAITAALEAKGAPVLIQEDTPSDTTALWVW